MKVGAKLFYRRGRTHLDGGGEVTIGRNLQCADTVQSFVNPCFLAAGSPFMGTVIVILLNILIAQMSTDYIQAKKVARLEYDVDRILQLTRTRHRDYVFKKYIAQNAIVFRDMYLQYPVYQRAEYQFASLELISCDWSTTLALGILESHCRFQL